VARSPKQVVKGGGVREQARHAKSSTPQHHLIGLPDGYTAKPTFVVDSGRKKLTLLWSDAREPAREPVMKAPAASAWRRLSKVNSLR
jgi:hypothetical protein